MADDDVLATALRWVDEGRGVALATVVQTWGSSPRPAGSHLGVRDDGLFVGSVSGGCVEGRVVEQALEVLHGGDARMLTFGVSDEEAWGVGLACGGTVRIRVERLPDEIRALQVHRTAHRPVALRTDLETGRHDVVADGDAVASALRADRAAVVDDRWFVVPYNPPLRLVIVGAVHVAQALAPMATMAGFDVTVVDPRAAFASEARFPGVRLNGDWPDDAIRALRPDTRTAVVALTHDPKLDDPALIEVLSGDAFYVGALGSTKTHEARRGRLRDAGVTDEQVARIRAPIGLAIGARTPAEIAVSILAEITRDLRQP